MKTHFIKKDIFAIILLLLLLPLKAFGDASPFTANASLLKDRISANDPIAAAITITIAPNHHIYKDQIKVESGNPDLFTIASVTLPAGRTKFDPFLEKETELYEEQIEARVFFHAAKDISIGSHDIKLKVSYQGCSDKVCFAPKTEAFTLPVQIESSGWSVPATQGEEKQITPISKSDKTPKPTGFQKTIENRGLFVSFLLIFLAGIGLSFTPCIYPMIPITVAVIGGQAAGGQSTARKPLTAFFLSLIYVLGIAIVYSAMGVTAASTGALFGAALQSPWVIGFVVAVFVALAMSMFGVYYLRMPSFISDRLGADQKKGVIGVFVMGLVSGIVASPCIGPALASLLVYIASTGNKFLGFWMLFVFAWGLGVLLIVVGTFSGAIKALPKSGTWMETVERLFGIILIGAALYYLRLIISEGAFVIILGLFLMVTAVFSWGFSRQAHKGAHLQRARKAFGLACFIFGIYFLAGYLIIRGFILPPLTEMPSTLVATPEEKIQWVLSEEDGIRQAKAENKTVMIDFWASWCAACMELEKITYADPEVIKELKKFVNVKIDCTNTSDPKIKQLWEKYSTVGLPTIIFINRDGTVAVEKTITGFVDAQKFLRVLQGL